MTSVGSPLLLRLPQHVQPIDLAFQLQVRYDHVDPLVAQHLDGVLARVDRQGLDGQLAEGLHHAVGMVPLVVHDQDDRFLLCPMTTQNPTRVLCSRSRFRITTRSCRPPARSRRRPTAHPLSYRT